MLSGQELLSSNSVFSMLTPGQMGHVLYEHGGVPKSMIEAVGKMICIDVNAGDEVVRDGNKGDRYYLIKEGEAEVWKPDPETGVCHCVARLGPGDTFGEEALLLGGFRNATVRMLTAGVLLELEEEYFNSYLRRRLVKEVTPQQAQVMARRKDTQWLDCRFHIEYSEVRIPGAQLVPLHVLRQSVHALDRDRRYLVYCRSGRRSICAAYLLCERGFNAVSVAGGIREWPYAVEHDG